MNRLVCQLGLATLLAAAPAAALDIDYVAVRDPGNAANFFGAGAVAYDFAISKYEITNSQYVGFLNEVANEVDANELWDPSMPGIVFPVVPIGFERFYEVLPGFENKPVVGVSFWDATRFANWLHNGQPRGLQDGTTTEDGAYQLTAPLIADNLVVRSGGAQAFVASEDEWVKAAYYDPALSAGLGGYHAYPIGAPQPTCAAPGPTPGAANCDAAVGGPTGVGSYPGSPSPYGTHDQGGNVWELTEEVAEPGERRVRGGAFDSPLNALDPTFSSALIASNDSDVVGFRVAIPVPEPGRALLAMTGALTLGAARRRRA